MPQVDERDLPQLLDEAEPEEDHGHAIVPADSSTVQEFRRRIDERTQRSVCKWSAPIGYQGDLFRPSVCLLPNKLRNCLNIARHSSAPG